MARSPFRSFWLGGFESATHLTVCGERLDLLDATQHDRFVAADYARVRTVGIHTVRDTMRWHLIERNPGQYDFSSVTPFLDASHAQGVQVIWDLLHYGVPCDVDLFSPTFPDRFAAFAGAAARYVRDWSSDVPCYTPINEVSFLSWAAAEVGWMHPCAYGRGLELKRQLVRAWVAAAAAIRAVDARACLISAEPLIHVVPPLGVEDDGGHAAAKRASQWEAWDMITGVREPELGGSAAALDVIGVNFYHDNQWEAPGGEKIAWHLQPRDSRWVPLHQLLVETWTRYGRPLCIAETSHVGVGRAEWIREITDEVCLALRSGVPLEGVCLYPIIDRCDWNDPSHWHNSGLWDLVRQPDGTWRRDLCVGYAEELARCQQRVHQVREAVLAPQACGR